MQRVRRREAAQQAAEAALPPGTQRCLPHGIVWWCVPSACALLCTAQFSRALVSDGGSPPSPTNTEQAWEGAGSILESLLSLAGVEDVFGAPVDARDFPDYPSVVERPMDLGTIWGEWRVERFLLHGAPVTAGRRGGADAPCFAGHAGWQAVHREIAPLPTSAERLEDGEYATPLQLRDDVRLVWSNCRQFNSPGERMMQSLRCQPSFHAWGSPAGVDVLR